MNNNDKKVNSMLGSKFCELPKIVQFELINRCNHNCIFCSNYTPYLKKSNNSHWKSRKIDYDEIERDESWKRKKLSYPLFKKIMKDLSGAWIQFTGGGEIFLHPKVMQFIKYTMKKAGKLQIFTNGTLIDKNKFKKLCKLKVNMININIPSATANSYVKNIPNQTIKNFDKLINNLIWLSHLKQRDYYPLIKIVNVVTNKNYISIGSMIKLADKVNAFAIEFVPLQIKVNLLKNLLLSRNQIMFLIKNRNYYLNLCKKHKLETNFDNFLKLISNKEALNGKYTFELYNKIGCNIGWYLTHVGVDGEVSPCCLHKPISVTNGDLKSVWLSKEYNEFRKKLIFLSKKRIKPKLCEGCHHCPHILDNLNFYTKFQNF